MNPDTKLAGGPSDDVTGKNDFMKALLLCPTIDAIELAEQIVKPSTQKRLTLPPSDDPKITKKCAQFFKSNPVELSSPMGQMMYTAILKETNEDYNAVPKKGRKNSKKIARVKSHIRTRSRSGFKSKDCHLASFTRRQRILHAAEIALGLNRKSWPNFNQCRQCSVAVEKMPDRIIKEYKLKRLNAKLKLCKRLVVINTDIMTIPAVVNHIKRQIPYQVEHVPVVDGTDLHGKDNEYLNPPFSEGVDLTSASPAPVKSEEIEIIFEKLLKTEEGQFVMSNLSKSG